MAAGAALNCSPGAAASTAEGPGDGSSDSGIAAGQPEAKPEPSVGSVDVSGSADGGEKQRKGAGGNQKRGADQKHPPRNRPCPCGSKAKFKNCCGSAARLRAAAASIADAAAPAAPQQLLV